MKRANLMSGVLAAALMLGGAAAYAEGMGSQGKADKMGKMRPMINFEEVDANADGKITKDEIAAMATTRFTKADADGDGFLSLEEMNAKGLEMAKKRVADRSAMMLERMDTDKDGKLSLAEMEAAKDKGPRGKMGGKMFDRADADGDGAISKAEFDAAQAKMQERMKDRKGMQKKGGGDCDRGGKWKQ